MSKSNTLKPEATYVSVKEWALEDRPREKLMMKGASALSDSELLAILIRIGTKNQSAVEVCQHVLATVDNDLNKLARYSVSDLTKTKGIGPAKAISIIAALELGRRRKNTGVKEIKKITCSRDAYQALYPHLSDLNHEEIWALFLNRSNRVESKMRVSEGGISSTVLDVRLVLREALNRYASGIILGHNHPTNNCMPSEQDIRITAKMKESAKIMDISLLDHLILCGDKYYSFADENMM
ncbi:MAG: DNA repair protein RadC [Bacteroidales bacterium]|nr:DNA repair protein RadC [Bacteroidales bacterium]